MAETHIFDFPTTMAAVSAGNTIQFALQGMDETGLAALRAILNGEAVRLMADGERIGDYRPPVAPLSLPAGRWER